jgi:hypothetical protein
LAGPSGGCFQTAHADLLFWHVRLAKRGIYTSRTPRRNEILCVRVGDNDAMESGFQCAACGEWNTTSVDESAGRRQSYVEDCQVCCKPNVLRVEYDNSSQEFFITAELE